MKVPYTLRKLDWEKTNAKGIPLDCVGIMNFFNDNFNLGNYPLVPRTELITEREILSIWVPKRNNNLAYIGVDNVSQKIICSGTLFLDAEKKTGELSITKDLAYPVCGIGTEIARKLIDDGLFLGFSVNVHTSLYNARMIGVMEKLGYHPHRIIHNYERYVSKIKAKDYDVYEWTINPAPNLL